jgi:hypothetical protein
LENAGQRDAAFTEADAFDDEPVAYEDEMDGSEPVT